MALWNKVQNETEDSPKELLIIYCWQLLPIYRGHATTKFPHNFHTVASHGDHRHYNTIITHYHTRFFLFLYQNIQLCLITCFSAHPPRDLFHDCMVIWYNFHVALRPHFCKYCLHFCSLKIFQRFNFNRTCDIIIIIIGYKYRLQVENVSWSMTLRHWQGPGWITFGWVQSWKLDLKSNI